MSKPPSEESYWDLAIEDTPPSSQVKVRAVKFTFDEKDPERRAILKVPEHWVRSIEKSGGCRYWRVRKPYQKDIRIYIPMDACSLEVAGKITADKIGLYCSEEAQICRGKNLDVIAQFLPKILCGASFVAPASNLDWTAAPERFEKSAKRTTFPRISAKFDNFAVKTKKFTLPLATIIIGVGDESCLGLKVPAGWIRRQGEKGLLRIAPKAKGDKRIDLPNDVVISICGVKGEHATAAGLYRYYKTGGDQVCYASDFKKLVENFEKCVKGTMEMPLMRYLHEIKRDLKMDRLRKDIKIR